MIEVHHFRVWNDEMKHWERPPAKRSAEAIAELKGEIVPDTGKWNSRQCWTAKGGTIHKSLAMVGHSRLVELG